VQFSGWSFKESYCTFVWQSTPSDQITVPTRQQYIDVSVLATVRTLAASVPPVMWPEAIFSHKNIGKCSYAPSHMFPNLTKTSYIVIFVKILEVTIPDVSCKVQSAVNCSSLTQFSISVGLFEPQSVSCREFTDYCPWAAQWQKKCTKWLYKVYNLLSDRPSSLVIAKTLLIFTTYQPLKNLRRKTENSFNSAFILRMGDETGSCVTVETQKTSQHDAACLRSECSRNRRSR